MASVTDKILREFQASCHALTNASDDVALEDARFIRFTELLQIGNLLDNPTFCRFSGGPSNQPWGLLGYSWSEEVNTPPETEEEEEETPGYNEGASYRYTFIHGFFETESTARKARKDELERVLKQLTRMVENTLTKQENFLVQDEHEIRDVQENLLAHHRGQSIDRISLMVITNTLITQEDLPRSVSFHGYEVPIDWWDFQRWAELRQSKSKREPVNFSFRDMGFKPVPVSGQQISQNAACYLTVLPGGLVADLYDNFHTRLLESNVRVFLSLKRKTNRGMVDTITHKPEMFVSYNNGLSATASDVEFMEEGTLTSITDFQIVNGGQTTATLYHAKKRLRKSLENVYVQLKLTVLKEAGTREEVVPLISRYANTQTAIRKSDFEANLPYLLDVSRLAGKTYLTTAEGYNRYYYFERMAGQYNEEKNKQGRGARLREWERRYPAWGKFDKIDLGRWMNLLNELPHVASSSAEKSFAHFVKEVRSNDLQITSNGFKTLVGFGLLFRRARKVCGTKNGREFPSIIGDSSVALATTIYAMGLLHHLTNGRFDYHLLFEQTLQEDQFDEVLKYIIKRTWKQLEKHGGTSVQEQTKKEPAWTFVKTNTKINNEQLAFLNKHCISEEELETRQQGDPNETERYFQLLQHYFGNKAQNFQAVYDQILINPKWGRYRAEVKNLQRKVQHGDVRITLQRLEKLKEIERRIELTVTTKNNSSGVVDLDIDFHLLYQKLFVDSSECLKNLEEQILSGSESSFDELSASLEEIHERVVDFEAWESISINDLEKLEEALKQFI